jgi:hypothetical protein
MLLSLMCADECGVVWPYLLESGDTDGIVAPETVAAIRAEYLEDVVAERRLRRLQATTSEANCCISLGLLAWLLCFVIIILVLTI